MANNLRGRRSNQLSLLLKLIALCANFDPPDPIEQVLSASQSHLLLRFLYGVIGETLVLLNKPTSHQVIKNYSPGFDENTKAAYAALSQHFGKHSRFQRLRNKFCFHFPDIETINAAFIATPPDEDWSLYMSESISNSKWLPSDLVMTFGLMATAGNLDPRQDFEPLVRETMTLASNVTDFLMGLYLAMMHYHFRGTRNVPEKVLTVADAPLGSEFCIPFFVVPPLGSGSAGGVLADDNVSTDGATASS